MSIFERLKSLFGISRRRESTSASAARVFAPIMSASTVGAMAIATVYRCVTLLSESVANLPLLYMRKKDGIFVPDENSRLAYLLLVEPNPTMTPYDLWTGVVREVLLEGNAYIVPVYSPDMLPERLVLCNRGTVSHDINSDTYTVNDSVNKVYGTYKEEDIVHFKNLSLDGKHGLSVLSYARQTLDIAGIGNKETFNRFANGGDVRGLVGNGTSIRGYGEYQDSELDKTAASIDEQFRGGSRIVSLPGQVDFKQLSLSSTDMQFLETRKFTVREICRFFGVHPSFVFDDTSNNYKSAEMANVAFLSNTLNPLLIKIEQELRRKLISPTLAMKRKFMFDRSSLFACDLASKVQYQTQTIAAGLYTVNEWRKIENKPAIEGGDTLLVSANLKDITEFGNNTNVNEQQDNNEGVSDTRTPQD